VVRVRPRGTVSMIELSCVGTFVSGVKSLKQPQWRRAMLQKSVVSSSVSAATGTSLTAV